MEGLLQRRTVKLKPYYRDGIRGLLVLSLRLLPQCTDGKRQGGQWTLRAKSLVNETQFIIHDTNKSLVGRVIPSIIRWPRLLGLS